MAEEGTITFEGKSGAKYEFKIFPFNTSWKAVAAVYAVTRREPKAGGGSTHITIYIGETDNLNERFDGHHKADCFRKNNSTHICVHQEKNAETRGNIEADILANYNWICND